MSDYIDSNKPFEYQFPPNRRAIDADIYTQAGYTAKEAKELETVVCSCESDIHIIKQALDVIQSSEGVLRKYPDNLVAAVREAVYWSCRAKEDYE